jgi:hypothetical protein
MHSIFAINLGVNRNIYSKDSNQGELFQRKEMSTLLKKVGDWLAVPPDQYELDEDEAGGGLAFSDAGNIQEEEDQVDWSDLRFAKLLSHQCIYAQYVDNKTGVLVNINSPMVPFLELFDAMMEARQEFAHGTSEVHRRPRRDQFVAPGTPEGIMSLSVEQSRMIRRQMEEWEGDGGGQGYFDNDLFDLATELVTQDEEAIGLYEGELEDERTTVHKKNDDTFTGYTDEETGDLESGTNGIGRFGEVGGEDIGRGGHLIPAPDIAVVVEHDEFTAPDTIPERRPREVFSAAARDEEGMTMNMVVNTYIHATLSEYDIYCIFVSMELSEGMFMATLDAWLNKNGDKFVDNPMEKFQDYLNKIFPLIPSVGNDADELADTGDERPVNPPRGTRSKLFLEREQSVARPLDMSSLSPDPPMGEIGKILGFDPSMYYMKRISEEYKERASAMVQIVTLLDSVLNGVSGIIDDAYAKYSTPHTHLESGIQSEGMMPKSVEVNWDRLKHIDSLVKEYRRWTKQITKGATQINK